MSVSVTYVDVSHHDWNRRGGNLDWARVKAATSTVMCARATYGDPSGFNPPSPHFRDFVTAATRAGVNCCGGYHNLIKGDQASINRQVDYLRRTMDGAGADWAMLDVERYPELISNGLWPRFDDVRQFCDRWHTVDGRVLTVYLPKWIWDGHLGRPDLRVLHAPLVASNYGSNPNGSPASVYSARGGDTGAGWAAYGGVTPAIWQYGSNVDCPGASGQTDCNAYRGSLAQLRTLLTGKSGEDDDMSWLDEASGLKDINDKQITWRQVLTDVHWGLFTSAGTHAPASLAQKVSTLHAALPKLLAQPVDTADEQTIIAGVLAGLGGKSPADVLETLRAAMTDQEWDEFLAAARAVPAG